MHRRPHTLATCLLLAALGACAGGASPVTAPVPDGGTAAASARAAVERARADSARLPYTEADIRFMTGMIAHHAQAIVMSRLAAANGAGAEVQRLAERIINAQRDEIRTMQLWLMDRRQPVPAVSPEGAVTGTGHAGHHGHAAGMLTDAQLDALRAARGDDFDQLYLLSMIQHHRGAVAMVEALFATDGAGQDESVFKLASDIQVDQRTEIARMERMFAGLPPERPR